ncbi:ABC transporter substrate-binding protein [Pelomonas sp. KK5]|uniref:ABC transporter substrate-binding protein n=1 Tax=Pelomonas sp. KK5 TaxID=1855730 RepID=UPI00097BDAB4|nr:ABC transporter substrate-binding protein [Pelomonas sp. KK5]
MKRHFLCALLASLAFAANAETVRIGVITSASGPTAVVGIPQKNSAALLPKKIGTLDVEYTVYDDGSDSTQTVALVKKLLSEQKVDAIIGPSGSPNAMAALQFVAEAKTPLLAPVGTTAVVLPMDEQKRWVFKTTQNDALICEALVAHMVRKGVKTAGFIGFGDAYGESWHRVFVPMIEKAGIRLVADERYQRTDQSVIGQALKIIAARPDAVLVGAAGGPTVLPQTTLVEKGYKGQVYQTHGAATPDFVRLGGKAVDGAVMAASLMLVLDEVPDANPSKKLALDYIGGYEKLYGSKPATFGANVYDAGLLLQRALPEAAKKGQPGTEAFRVALRDALEGLHEVVGTQGVYTMSPADHSGFDRRGRELMQLQGGTWHRVAE